jgi:hypothetical protein
LIQHKCENFCNGSGGGGLPTPAQPHRWTGVGAATLSHTRTRACAHTAHVASLNNDNVMKRLIKNHCC